MNRKLTRVLVSLLLLSTPVYIQAREWTLEQCIEYALQNNIQIQKTRLQKQSATEDWLESQAKLLPTLNASTTQSVNYTPWVESGISSDGYSRSSVDKVYYNGSYGINANWTIWNGNRNKNTIKLNKLTEEKAAIDSASQAQSIQEQIAQLYVQILYSEEAIKVDKENLESSKGNEQRGKEMMDNGKMSKADYIQLTAQTAQDQYSIVQAESQARNYKRQLKELLEITNEDFDIIVPSTTDDMALQDLPELNGIYASALDNRPEIKGYQNLIDQSKTNIEIAKASNLPTISATAGINTSMTSMNSTNFGKQLKTNFTSGAGITVSIPILDNRSRKTAVNKARIQQQSAMLDLKSEQTTLYSTIENYWIQASSNQNQFKAAKVSSTSAQESYDLISEKFKEGLANIVDVRTQKDNLLKAKQSELQAKYLTILNLNMLNFYKTGSLKD
jgi:outer membrane protein